MKTKIIAIVGATVLTLGIGTAAYAAEIGPSSFKDMLPFIKEMHPTMNDSQLEQMYNNCHQKEGNSDTRGMMQNNDMMQRTNAESI
ncbi:hypothetical protein MUG84_24020 [Paenibacillus sp. KQZ6P-2]|uniref:FAD/FMN-containing dehydrogenase n=1 Tax=Paenibacillus mangrovi TaxID=2931978 RepID=A0A9X1WTK0_9BACL|nr:hypothetical protein [Paenibacillus mangrovi]MCJ8014753.1 hypothetical protein [Paenibacillus mangrovi]